MRDGIVPGARPAELGGDHDRSDCRHSLRAASAHDLAERAMERGASRIHALGWDPSHEVRVGHQGLGRGLEVRDQQRVDGGRQGAHERDGTPPVPRRAGPATAASPQITLVEPGGSADPPHVATHDSIIPPFTADAPKVQAFVERWRGSEASEIQNTQMFLSELCDLLEVGRPDPATGDPEKDLFCFERPVRLGGKETHSVGRIDLYKADHFVLEAKQGSDKGRRLGAAKRGSPAWAVAMSDAYGQALGYAQSLPSPPPFLIVADVGYAFDLYACFDGSGQYRMYPDPPTHRVFFSELVDQPKQLARLRAVFQVPRALDPSLRQAKVTREIAEKLAELAHDLEESGNASGEAIAKFLMRCIFAMFAEDVGLFPNRRHLFTEYLRDYWVKNPASFPGGVEQFFRTMNTGGTLMSGEQIHRFNGGLYREAGALKLTPKQLAILLDASEKDWSDVEPAIFGTLLERALDPKERHALGAHYTPRAYVERLVRPTIEEPLRREWLVVQAEANELVAAGKVKKALEVVDAFHRRLCTITVLDPACGSGNFLYVALDLMKELEGEVLQVMRVLAGSSNELLALEGVTVTPKQFRGIEKKPWAKEIAELVLWIGYLRNHYRLKGKAAAPPDPVLQDYQNIECRDAVLAWDGEPVLRRDETGEIVTRCGTARRTSSTCSPRHTCRTTPRRSPCTTIRARAAPSGRRRTTSSATLRSSGTSGCESRWATATLRRYAGRMTTCPSQPTT